MNKMQGKTITMIALAIASTLGLIPIILDSNPNASAQNTFMTPDQQSRLGPADANGDYPYNCENGNTITIPGGIKFTAESFTNYVIAFCG